MTELKNIKKTYKERVVLNIPSLSVADGECLAVAGANGSGKTTLLKILAGQLKTDCGEICVPETVIYMPQRSYAFRGNLTDNIMLGRAEKTRAEYLLEQLELSHLKNKKAVSLSGGELQRLSLCRVLARRSDLLLLDEPTSACDAKGAELVMNAIGEYRKQYKCTVLMSTHSPALAIGAAQRLIVLNSGKIEADGAPENVLTNPETEWAKSFIAGWKI